MSGQLASLEELATLREQLRSEQAAARSADPDSHLHGRSCIASGTAAVNDRWKRNWRPPGWRAGWP